MDPVQALSRIAFLLERELAETFRIKAFRKAIPVLQALGPERVAELAQRGTLTSVEGIGDKIATIVTACVRGETPAYLADLEAAYRPLVEGGEALRSALRGDCHLHSDWSDGGSPIRDMALTARDLGHEYAVLTDHSPRLTVANGLTADRLLRQLDVVAELNEELAPFRLLTGIEVDILDDGALDQEAELLDRLDVVVASVHSKLRMPSAEMTPRMLAAVSNPLVDVLGHCTGRMVVGRNGVGKGRPESEFDAELVFAACRDHGVAVEVNARPERLDPPSRLLRLAVEMGCVFTIDTDAHAPGQLDWQPYGCARAEAAGVPVERVINAQPLDALLAHVN